MVPCTSAVRLLSALLFSTIAAACSGQAPTPTADDPIRAAAIAFVGAPAPSAIRSSLDRALTLYGETPSNEMYNRAASALVALRQDSGISEMTILDHMIQSHVDGSTLNFPEAAALSVTFLKAGDR